MVKIWIANKKKKRQEIEFVIAGLEAYRKQSNAEQKNEEKKHIKFNLFECSLFVPIVLFNFINFWVYFQLLLFFGDKIQKWQAIIGNY